MADKFLRSRRHEKTKKAPLREGEAALLFHARE